MKITDKEFNKYRKDILLKIDSKQLDSLESLDVGYYGLTPYLKDIDISKDSRICDFYYRYSNTKYLIEHLHKNSDTKYFMPIQYDALKFIVNNERSIILAPTSFGKTMIVKEYIYLHHPHTAVFIVPTNALAYELQKSIAENDAFSNYKMFDKASSEEDVSNQLLLFIGTQERFLESRQSIKRVDFAVIDEAYKLADSIDNNRCYKLSKSFLEILSNYNCKICLLAPNALLIGFEEFGFEKFETTFNAVDKYFTVIGEDNFYTTLNEKKHHEKTILYCRVPEEMSKIANYIDGEEKVDNSFTRQVIDDFHKDWSVAKLLSKGVLSHSGLMPKYLQNKMLCLFNKKDSQYKLLVGTNSISEGINTPTKNLFIHPDCANKESLMLIKNTIGRAGRLGVFPIGHVYSTIDYEEKMNQDVILEVAAITEKGSKEIDDTINEGRINNLCDKYSITSELYNMIIDKYNISHRRFEAILSVFKNKNYKRSSYTNIVWITYNVLKRLNGEYYYPEAETDASYIVHSFLKQYYYKNIDIVNGERIYKNPVYLSNYGHRIEYVKHKMKLNNKSCELSNSEIMDKLIKMNFSKFDYDYYPIALIAKDIKESIPNWPFGENVLESINHFTMKYYKYAFGKENLDDLTDNEKAVLFGLKELGLNIRDIMIDKEIIDEIVSKLDVRYSMYDIVNAMKKLSTESKNKKIYSEILDKYLDYAI